MREKGECEWRRPAIQKARLLKSSMILKKAGSSYRVSISVTNLSGETVYVIEVFHLSKNGEVTIAKGGKGVIISERR